MADEKKPRSQSIDASPDERVLKSSALLGGNTTDLGSI